VMDKAAIVAAGTPRELIEKYATREVLELRIPDAARGSLDGKLDGLAERVEELPDRFLLYADDGEKALEDVHGREIPIDSALVRRATLEDVFLRLTGRSLVE
jgi:lipooligosaccharide transport system ATP-binding protein